MATIKFELKKSKKNDKGEAPIYMRFTVGSHRADKSTDIWIKPSQWNKKKQEVRSSQNKSDKSETINLILSKLRAKAKEAIRDFTAENKLRELEGKHRKRLTPAVIKNRTFNKNNTNDRQYFIAYAKKIVERFKKRKSYNTWKKNNSIVNKFEKWIINHDEILGNDILFQEITIGLIKDYHSYLVDDVGNALNTAKKDIKSLGTIYKKAIKEEIVSHRSAPFEYVDLPTTQVQRPYLEQNELSEIKKLQLSSNSLMWNVRNYFLFQIYTAGLRVSDLCVLTWDAIVNNRFEYTMRKTSQKKSLVLVEPARQILQKYGPAEKSALIFPILDKPMQQFKSDWQLDQAIINATSNLNNALERIQKKAELDKHLTTHIARHTFANSALKSGWSKEDIQQALGHASIATTEDYLNSFNEDTIDNNMRNLFENNPANTHQKGAA